MQQDDLTIILSFCFVIMMGVTSVVAYSIGQLRKRLSLFDTELRAVQFKLRLWDALIYGDDNTDLATGQKPAPPVRRGNVVYLTPPEDE